PIRSSGAGPNSNRTVTPSPSRPWSWCTMDSGKAERRPPWRVALAARRLEQWLRARRRGFARAARTRLGRPPARIAAAASGFLYRWPSRALVWRTLAAAEGPRRTGRPEAADRRDRVATVATGSRRTHGAVAREVEQDGVRDRARRQPAAPPPSAITWQYGF